MRPHALILPVLLATTLAGCRRPAPAPTTSTAAPVHYRLDKGDRAHLTFGTYNVRGLADPRGLEQDLHRLEFVDAWAMQEVSLPLPRALPDRPTTSSLPQLEAILPAGRWHIVYLPVNRSGGDLWEGQAIASRFPILRVEVWTLDRSAPKHRVALAAWLHTPRGEVLFVNADHEVGGPADWGWPGPADRGKQIRSLAARLGQHSDARTVLAGDFNTTGALLEGITEAAEIATLNRALADLGFAGLGPAFDRAPTFRWANVGWHLDHLFLRHLTADAWDVSTSAQGSDHYPLWCRVKGPAAAPTTIPAR